MNEAFYIQKIIKEIERKLNWKSVAFWTDYEYKKLSQQIQETTTISISPQTLKRLFGKVKYKEIYSPQPATKDALAMFLGYQDWLAYVNSEKNKKPFPRKLRLIKNLPKSFKPAYIAGVLAVLILFLVILSINLRKPDEQPIVFHARNLSGTAPHTISIHYDVSKIKDQDVYIDFDQNEAEGPGKPEKLDKNRKLINYCFETPGFYTVRLLVDNKVRSSVKVHVFSEGWASYYFNDDNFSLRKFVLPLENKVSDKVKDSLLYISPENLIGQGFNGNTVYYLEHLRFKEFGLLADSGEMEVKFKNSAEIGSISCSDVEFRITGENGLVSVMLVQKGCYRWSEVTIGEVHMNGKFDNLSNLSLDMNSWNILKIQINNGKATVINGQDTLLSCSYQQPIGMLKGIRFVTKGSGAFDYVKLMDARGILKFEDHFDN